MEWEVEMIVSEPFERYLRQTLAGSEVTVAQVREALRLLQPMPAMKPTKNIYVIGCFLESDIPTGGAKMLYRHVDVLNKHGFTASVVHAKPEFRFGWFENNTTIRYLTHRFINTSDILVFPEMFGPYIAEIGRGTKKVVYNQNCYCTFQGYSFDAEDRQTGYLDEELLATIVVSEDSRSYMEHVFGSLRILRIRHSINPDIFFNATSTKKKQICFMPRKKQSDALQVINILKFRNVLNGFELVPIHNKREQEVAAILRDSLIYLSTGTAEGFGLPPAEAMACGCIVIGYHGGGGKEYFQPWFSYPIAEGDVLAFAKTVERVIEIHHTHPETLTEMGRAASEYIRTEYSPTVEEQDIVNAWRTIMETTG
jgi:Glycosyl transferases group 1